MGAEDKSIIAFRPLRQGNDHWQLPARLNDLEIDPVPSVGVRDGKTKLLCQKLQRGAR
jgi:hypothetical protein